VVFTFGYEGNTYRVQRVKPRNKTALLEFHIQTGDQSWKPLTERTLRDTEARIESTLRLDYETFVNASFFLQGKADQFTQQRAGDRKRILTSILGLEIWEQYRRASFERRKQVDAQIAELDGRTQEINAELAEENDRVRRLKDLESQLKTLSDARNTQESTVEEMRRRAAAIQEQEKLVAALADQLARSQNALAQLQEKQGARQAEKEGFAGLLKREEKILVAHQAWQKTRQALEEWEEIAGKFRQHEARRQQPLTEIETARVRLEADLDNLSQQQQALEAAQAEADDFKEQLKTAEQELQTINARIEERDRLDAALNEAIQKQSVAQGENPLLKAEMDALKTRIEQLQKTNGAACPTCGQPLTARHRKDVIAELTAEGTHRGDRYRDNQTLLKEHDQTVKELQSQLNSLNSLDEHLREHTRAVDQLSSHLETLKEQEKKWKKDGAPRLKELQKKLKSEDFAAEARKTLAAIDAELKATGYDAAAHDKVRQQEAEQRAAAEEFRELEKAKAALEPLEREIKDLSEQIKAQEKEIKQQVKAHDEAAAGLAAAQAEAPDTQAAERKMLDLQEDENKIRQEVGAAQQLVAVLADLKERKKELEGGREQLAQKAGQYKSLERAFGKDGVPAMLIEQALPQIEVKANEVLERLSGGDMSIRFITQQEYKDAKRDDLKETLEIQISDSAGVRDYEMFSGGEAFRINFAIRLALSEVLASRAGARLQTLVIDEGFGSQDEAGRQRLVEAINLVKEDFAKILVITHIDALKDAFSHRIEVEKTPRGSLVSVI
jgi:exonuclease SbcC